MTSQPASKVMEDDGASDNHNSHSDLQLKLIIMADDLGIAPERDEGIFAAFENGIVTSASLFVNGSTSREAAQRAASIGLPIGLHLNLTEGPPLAPVNMVPSLVQPQTQWWFPRAEHDRDGDTALHMRGKIGLREALKQCQISMEEVGIEVEAQLEAFKNLTGATPVYLNGHQHVHVLPGIAAVVARVAAREGVQFMRIPDELPRHFQEHVDASRCSLYKSVSSQAADARFVLRDESLQTSDSFIGLGLMGADCSPDRLFLRLQALLQDAAAASCAHDASPSESARNGDGVHGARPHMCAGSSGEQVYIGEYMCHVGKASASGDDFNKSKEREEELRVLTLPEVHRWLQRNNVVLTSYHELARLSRSSRRAARPSAEPLSPRLDKMQRGRRLESGEEEEVGGGAGRQSDTQTGGDRDDTNVRGNSEPARSEAKRGGGNLLILSSMTAATGNATTAQRLAGVAQSHGWQAGCQDVSEIDDAAHLRALVQEKGVTGIIGIHAFRAGKLLLGSAVPYCIILGGTDVNVMADDVEKCKVMQQAIENAAALVAFSREMVSKMRQRISYSGPTFIIPQTAHVPLPAACQSLNPLVSLLGLPESTRLFLLPCGLRQVKDPCYLIGAFSEWHSKDASVMLCIVGPSLDAEYESKVCAAIRATVQSDPARRGGVSGCCQLDEGVMGAGVMYHRAVPHEELVLLMKHSFALVNSSLSEGMCGSLLEALALSVPVLARAAPGNLELIRHKRTGLLFNSPQECVALAQTYLLDSNLRHHLVLSGKCYADQYHSSSTEHQLLGQTLLLLSKTSLER